LELIFLFGRTYKMIKLSTDQFSELLDTLEYKSFFINRWGGSDIESALILLDNTNSIDSCLITCSVWMHVVL